MVTINGNQVKSGNNESLKHCQLHLSKHQKMTEVTADEAHELEEQC